MVCLIDTHLFMLLRKSMSSELMLPSCAVVFLNDILFVPLADQCYIRLQVSERNQKYAYDLFKHYIYIKLCKSCYFCHTFQNILWCQYRLERNWFELLITHDFPPQSRWRDRWYLILLTTLTRVNKTQENTFVFFLPFTNSLQEITSRI